MEYTIGETAEKMGLSVSTIRYYDKEGLLPFLERNDQGIRKFSTQDLEHLNLIKCLKASNMPIAEIQQFFKWYLIGDTTLTERRDMFYERKIIMEQQMRELQATMQVIHDKCTIYDKAVALGSLHEAVIIERTQKPLDN